MNTSVNQRTNERDARYVWGEEGEIEVVKEGDGEKLDLETAVSKPTRREEPKK